MAISLNKLSHALILLAMLVISASANAQENIDSRPKANATINAQGVDPTKNVLDLVSEAIRRQDDLRAKIVEILDAKLSGLQELNNQRSKFDRDILKAAVDRLDSEAKLRAEFSTTIAATEKARVDAIRLVDTGAVAIANERATATANTLAKTVTDTAQALSTQVTRNAEDLRLLVKTTADEQTRNLQQQFAAVQNQFTGLSTRITALEQTGAEGIGKQKYQDPAIASMLAELKSQREIITANVGKSEGVSSAMAGLMAVGGLLLAMLAIGIPLLLRSRANGNGSSNNGLKRRR